MAFPSRRETVVLVVEDDAATRALFRLALAVGEFTVVDVDDGMSALRYLDTHEPAAVVLDLGLPQLHGRDVITEVAARGSTVPIVVVTGTDEQIDNRPVSSVLRKPITGDRLIDAVRRAIRSHRSFPPTS